MKSTILIVVMAIIFSLSGNLYAHEGMNHDEGMESMDHEKWTMMEHDGSMMNKSANTESEMHVATEEEVKTLPNVGNKICPVSGDKIPAPGEKGAMGEAVKYEYNGKIYNLCCKMCVKDFKKNPEKYSKIAEDEVAKEKMMQKNQDGQKNSQK